MGRLMAKFIGIDECLKRDFGKENNKIRNMNNIRSYFDLYEADKYTIDDETWDDFNMDSIFSKLDRSNSSLGEAVLYYLLRTPLNNKEDLNKRDKIINDLLQDVEARTRIQSEMFILGYDKKNSFLEMIQDEATKNNGKYYLYLFLGKILPLILIVLTCIFKIPQILMALFVLILVNMLINNYEKKHVKASGMLYLADILTAANNIAKIKSASIDGHREKIKSLLSKVKEIRQNTKAIFLANTAGGAFEIISIPFLLEETAYYRINTLVKEKEDDLLELYYLLGELEAYISVASYKKEMQGKFTNPIFTDEVSIKISNGIHPLIKDAVPNSIQFKKRGIVLTGTNMSGKSTFLRMLGINIIFAQCFNFVLAEKYEACFFNIVSSISPNDDVLLGKSYYMAEAESLLRIINSLNYDLPVFCPIDEIFRGTNPIERISASAEILNYISTKKSISIVATHDRELTDILKNNYEFYYFSEKVDKKGLSFDYKIKHGVTKTRNAIRLLEQIGYPKEIIKGSYERAEKLEKYL